jgi:dihydroorotase
MLDLVLQNVLLPDGRRKDIEIHQGQVRHIGAAASADLSINCQDLLCIPGAIDMHVHMRGGTERHKEDWETGSQSAIAGGVTMVVDQPNTDPPLDTLEAFQNRVYKAGVTSCCHFAVNAGISPHTDLPLLWKAGAMAFGEIFVAPSTGGSALSWETLIPALDAIHRMDALATIHAEELPFHTPQGLIEHDALRSIQGEATMIKRVLSAAPSHQRLHFCHLSSARSVDAVHSTYEVTPHHLFLSRERFMDQDARGKVNPPLRTEKERRDLWTRWEAIPVIASDHAPHTLEEKTRPFPLAPAGFPGVETMVPLLMGAVLKGSISLPSLVEKISDGPARILGITPAGFRAGCRADFALFPRELTVIGPELLHSRCGWTPYEGMEAVFPDRVILDGAIIYQEREYFPTKGRWFPGRGYIGESTI